MPLARLTYISKYHVMRHSKYQHIIDWNKRHGDHRRLGYELIGEIHVLMTEASSISEAYP